MLHRNELQTCFRSEHLVNDPVVKDATAAPKHPKWGYGYTAALINYAFLAHAVLRADEAIDAMKRGQR